LLLLYYVVFFDSNIVTAGVYGEGKRVQRFWWGNLRERDHLGDPDVDGRIILRWIFRKLERLWGLDVAGSGWEQEAVVQCTG
jgi:hypothetical protein